MHISSQAVRNNLVFKGVNVEDYNYKRAIFKGVNVEDYNYKDCL
jgi:hypothetical protein